MVQIDDSRTFVVTSFSHFHCSTLSPDKTVLFNTQFTGKHSWMRNKPQKSQKFCPLNIMYYYIANIDNTFVTVDAQAFPEYGYKYSVLISSYSLVQSQCTPWYMKNRKE